MKLMWGLLGYLAGAAALAGSVALGLSYALPPADGSGQAPRLAATPPEQKAAAAGTSVDPTPEPDRVPVWIAPTAKYAPVVVNTARRAREMARRGGSSDDWRSRERAETLGGDGGWSGFAPQAAPRRGQQAEGPRYREPIQFREKTEPR
jgi:hypothetical protein